MSASGAPKFDVPTPPSREEFVSAVGVVPVGSGVFVIAGSVKAVDVGIVFVGGGSDGTSVVCPFLA